MSIPQQERSSKTLQSYPSNEQTSTKRADIPYFPVLFSGKNPQEGLYTLEKLKGEKAFLEEQVNSATEKLTVVVGRETVGGAQDGAAFGTAIGVVIGTTAESIIHFSTFGASALFLGSVTGGCAALGGTIGAAISGSKSASEIRGGLAELKGLLKHVDEQLLGHQSELKALESLKSDISKYSHVDQMEQNAVTLLVKGSKSSCLDVQKAAKPIYDAALKVPGFAETVKDVIKLFEAIQQVVKDAQSKSPEVRILALQRLFNLESRSKFGINNSKMVYPHLLLNDPDPRVQVEALKGLVAEELIQPTDYNQILEIFLKRPEVEFKSVVLDGIQKKPFRSGSIDVELERISDRNSTYPKDLRDKAEAVLNEREQQGIYQSIKPAEVAKTIMEGFVAPKALERELTKLLSTYKMSILDNSNVNANLSLYLPGEPGIGKTLLISRISKALFNSPDSLVYIDMGNTKTLFDLQMILKKAEPLSGKVVFFDEFQGLDACSPSEQRQIIEFLKPLFEKNAKVQGFDFKDSLLAVATNIPLDLKEKGMESLGTAHGKALQSRILSFSDEIQLSEDMREHIDQLVDRFDSQKYYMKEFPKLEGIRLSDEVKAYFKVLLKQKFPETSDKSMSGRMAVAFIAKQVEHAISDYMLNVEIPETDELGRLRNPATVILDDEQELRLRFDKEADLPEEPAPPQQES